MTTRKHLGESGTSLLETLVALAASAVVAAGGYSFYQTQLKALGDHQAAVNAGDKSRAGLNFIAREIGLAAYDPRGSALSGAAAGSRGIQAARTDRLTVAWDANGNGTLDAAAVDPNAETVTYSYDAGSQSILRAAGGAAALPFITNVPANGLVFQYFDKDNNALTPTGSPAELSAADRDKVALVRIRIQVEAPRTQRETKITMTSRAMVPNRMLEKL